VGLRGDLALCWAAILSGRMADYFQPGFQLFKRQRLLSQRGLSFMNFWADKTRLLRCAAAS
jgi:hypothetical protein